MPIPAAPTAFLAARIGIDHLFQGQLSNKAAIKFTFANNQAGATHVIQRKRVDEPSDWRDRLEIGDGRSEGEIHGLPLAAKFRFRIRSEFAGTGEFSPWLELASVVTTPRLPTSAVQINAPSMLAVASNTHRGVVLTWQDNASNESEHLVMLHGPGLPAAGLQLSVDHLASGSLRLPIGFPIGGSAALDWEKTYSAAVKARGGKQTTPSNTFDTDFTAEVAFTTAAAATAIVNLPATVMVERGAPFSFRIITVPSAVTITITAGVLPTGLTLTDATISGTTTDPVGDVVLTIEADNGVTTDTQTLTLQLRPPPFFFTNLPATIVAWNTAPLLFIPLTNLYPDVINGGVGAYPDGVGLVGGTGGPWSFEAFFVGLMTDPNEPPMSPEGLYTAILEAIIFDVASTSTVITFDVRTPSVRVLLKPSGSELAPAAGEAWGEVVAPLGQVFQWDVIVEQVGPMVLGASALEDEPGWLSLVGAQITGTPTETGLSVVRVRSAGGYYRMLSVSLSSIIGQDVSWSRLTFPAPDVVVGDKLRIHGLTLTIAAVLFQDASSVTVTITEPMPGVVLFDTVSLLVPNTFIGETSLAIRVPTLSITSANHLEVDEGDEFEFNLTSVPAGNFSAAELPFGVSIISPAAATYRLKGNAAVPVGVHEFEIRATSSEGEATQIFTLTVRSRIAVGGDGNADLIEGWKGELLFEKLSYTGDCPVMEWYLNSAPPGVTIGSLTCDQYAENARNIAAITGIPTGDGFFDAVVVTHVCCEEDGGSPKLFRRNVRFAINGDLFLSWLHRDPMLYDLQMQLRGDDGNRRVQSWYQRLAQSESRSNVVTKETSAGLERTTTAEVVQPAVSAKLLTMKRGDFLKLALLIRDGRVVLDDEDGIADVAIAFRRANAPDGEYFFDKEGVLTEVEGHTYYLVEFEVTNEMMDDLMISDAVSEVKTLGEIRGTLNGQPFSSASFEATFVEDVAR